MGRTFLRAGKKIVKDSARMLCLRRAFGMLRSLISKICTIDRIVMRKPSKGLTLLTTDSVSCKHAALRVTHITCDASPAA